MRAGRKKRKRRRPEGLPKRRGPLGHDWSEVDFTRPTQELIEELGISHQWLSELRARAGVDCSGRRGSRGAGTRSGFSREFWADIPLGEISDKALAEALEVGESVIRAARKELGKQSFRDRKKRIDIASDPRLGKVSDEDLACELGCHRNTIYNWRQRLGVPAFNQKS